MSGSVRQGSARGDGKEERASLIPPPHHLPCLATLNKRDKRDDWGRVRYGWTLGVEVDVKWNETTISQFKIDKMKTTNTRKKETTECTPVKLQENHK